MSQNPGFTWKSKSQAKLTGHFSPVIPSFTDRGLSCRLHVEAPRGEGGNVQPSSWRLTLGFETCRRHRKNCNIGQRCISFVYIIQSCYLSCLGYYCRVCHCNLGGMVLHGCYKVLLLKLVSLRVTKLTVSFFIYIKLITGKICYLDTVYSAIHTSRLTGLLID